MPSSLPDPVLALSLVNVQKLNNVDLDQLANLWNVFTKCKESLESGRRLENLSWRLWFREAHLLPPDTSLSDLTDYTPLDTPLMSRRGSVTGSFQSNRAPPVPFPPSAFQGLPSVQVQHPPTASLPLSDPEDGNWSDDDEEVVEEGIDATTKDLVENKAESSRGRTPTRSESAMDSSPKTNNVTKSKATIASSQRTLSTTAEASNRSVGQRSEATNNQLEIQPQGSGLGVSSAPIDRKRAVSSSSAFGSRARVKQHNTVRRRRPLSFQQAIESLLLDHNKDFSLPSRVGQQEHSTSLREGMTDVGVDSNGHDWGIQSCKTGEDVHDTIVQQSSAPAEFSQPNTPSISLINSPNVPPTAASAAPLSNAETEKRMMPPPLAVPSRSKAAEAMAAKNTQTDDQNRKNASKFFVAGQSMDDGASSISGSLVASFNQTDRGSSSHSPEQVQSRRAPSEANSDISQRQQGHGRGASHTKVHHGLATGGKNRSAVGLNRTGGLGVGGRGRGHGRVASAGRGLHTMTGHTRPPLGEHSTSTVHENHSDKQEVAVGHVQKGIEEGSRKEGKTSPAGRAPVKFIMGGEDDDDDDEFTDEDSDEEEEEEHKLQSKTIGKGTIQRRDSKAKEEEEDDEWSSASSTDSEEVRKRTVAQKRREEEKRQQEMFQKVPIKSASTADVRNLGRRLSAPIDGREEEDLSTSPMPVRSLLSSLFHPEEGPHSPPGQLAGRPHASAADLRQRPKRLSDSRGTEEENTGPVRRVPSSTQVPSMGGGGLKLSKSAVALPVLSTMGSRSESKKMEEVRGSREAAVFDDEETDGSDGEGHHQYGTSEALSRLNQLANQKRKKKQTRENKRDPHQVKEKRSSNSSLNVEVTPEIDEEAMMVERSRQEAKQAAMPTPSLSSHRSASASNIPEAGLPQTPRTTRRNMLRDELSESLRQNLLWERQSRNRMLGIGATNNNNNNNKSSSNDSSRNTNSFDSRSRSQVAPVNRNHSVLGGGALRPLTASNSTTSVANEAQRRLGSSQQRQQSSNNNNNNNNNTAASYHHHYTGDFHQSGW